MISSNFTKILIRRKYFCYFYCRSFSESNGNLVKLFDELKEANNRNDLWKFSSEFRIFRDFKTPIYFEDSKLVETEKFSKCVVDVLHPQTTLSSPYRDKSCDLILVENKDLIISCFRDLLRSRNKNRDFLCFLSDSLGLISKQLDFDQLFVLTNSIVDLDLGDSLVDTKISALLDSLLGRINFLITQNLSNSRGIVKVSSLPKFAISREKPDLDFNHGINLSSNDQVDKLWVLWYKLSNHKKSDYNYTISLILSLLELEKNRIFQYDLRRVTRTLDILVGECELFSKSEERLIVAVLKRFSSIMSSSEIEKDPTLFIKTNNITPVQVRKFFCNISRISKVSPKVLVQVFGEKNTKSGFLNFFKLSKTLLASEFSKIFNTGDNPGVDILGYHSEAGVTLNGFDSNNRGLSQYLLETFSDVSYKYTKLFLKVFTDSVELLKFLDYLRLGPSQGKNSNQEESIDIENVRNELIGLSHELLRSISPKTPDRILSEGRSTYYLFLSTLLSPIPIEVGTLGHCDIFETVFNKIQNNSKILTTELDLLSEKNSHSSNSTSREPISPLPTEGGDLVYRSVQYLSYCDKTSSLFREFELGTEKTSELQRTLENLAFSLSKNYGPLLSLDNSYGLKTLYFTMLNKYSLLDTEFYSQFLSAIGNWASWGRSEISMLCDLFSRTHPLAPTREPRLNSYNSLQTQNFGREILRKIGEILKSLDNYLFSEGNVSKFGNKELVSFLTSLKIYSQEFSAVKHENTTSGNENTVTSDSNSADKKKEEVTRRLENMNFKLLVKLLSLDNPEWLSEDLKEQIISKIIELPSLGEISCLKNLKDKKLVSKILDSRNIEIVNETYIHTQKTLKSKFLKKFGKLNFEGNYTTQNTYDLLKSV